MLCSGIGDHLSVEHIRQSPPPDFAGLRDSLNILLRVQQPQQPELRDGSAWPRPPRGCCDMKQSTIIVGGLSYDIQMACTDRMNQY